MKILLAADGSKYTQRALDFIVMHKQFVGHTDELLLVHVQMLLPAVFTAAISVEKALESQEEEAEKVFSPMREFLDKKSLKYRCVSVIGSIAKEIVSVSEK